MRHSHLAGLAVLAVIGTAPPLAALPTMIRLGYTNCAACHISPQGAGLLNSYGRGIDEAQSLRAGEYQPSENSLIRTLSWGGRITQDVRTVVQEQVSTVGSQPAKSFFRPRFTYRNVTELGKGFRSERLHVQRPFEEHLVAGKAEVVARLASQATVGVGIRIQQDVITGRLGKALVIQAAFKTVD